MGTMPELSSDTQTTYEIVDKLIMALVVLYRNRIVFFFSFHFITAGSAVPTPKINTNIKRN